MISESMEELLDDPRTADFMVKIERPFPERHGRVTVILRTHEGLSFSSSGSTSIGYSRSEVVAMHSRVVRESLKCYPMPVQEDGA